jgi:hypothetical protein
MLSGMATMNSPPQRQVTRSSLKRPLRSRLALAWAMVKVPSSIAER